MTEEAQSLEDRAAALERKLTDLEATTNARLIHAELKAEAVRAGMVDLDGLKLLDTANLKLNPAGEVEGASTIMKELRKLKPWLFGPLSSSSTAAAPPAQAAEAKRATQMSYQEWQAARAELVRRK